ncbi:hypothetical protein HA402_014512 [Bradysia odoriphaga]|nr:hypothetical protein HA402_014512 [Bradysia odoriphaga]
MSEYEDEDSRTVFIANLSDKVTEALLYELFMQGGPLEKVAQPKDKDGRARTFAFVTYVHAVSVPYAVSLFQGTQLFNRELTIKPRNSNNPNAQQRPENPMTQQPQPLRNPFDSNSRFGNDGSSRFDRSDQQSSLRSGFNPIPTKASMQMQPLLSQRSGNQPQTNAMSIDVSKLISMGSNMLQLNVLQTNSRQFDVPTRPTYDMLFADRDSSARHSSNLKMQNRHNSRSHYRDEPYSRRSPPRHKQRSGDRRRR